MKILIATDKFKGSLNCFEACKTISSAVKNCYPNAEVLHFPLADGGDGFAAVMQYYLKTITVYCEAVDALGRKKSGSYQWSANSKTAIVDLATVSGLAHLSKDELNPLLANTLGTGLLIKDAIVKGANKIILGVGGSASNDAGLGILSALGFIFFDSNWDPVEPNGLNLSKIKAIKRPTNFQKVEFEIACDVNNPFYGPNGAAHVYAPQKGASTENVIFLDEGLKNIAEIFHRESAIDISHNPGAGAAGGTAGGLMAMLNAKLVSGIELIVSISEIEKSIENTTLLITGEGKLDTQSFQGKVIGSVVSLAKAYSIPCIAFCGKVALSAEDLVESGLNAAYEIAPKSVSLEASIKNANFYLYETVFTQIAKLK